MMHKNPLNSLAAAASTRLQGDKIITVLTIFLTIFFNLLSPFFSSNSSSFDSEIKPSILPMNTRILKPLSNDTFLNCSKECLLMGSVIANMINAGENYQLVLNIKIY